MRYQWVNGRVFPTCVGTEGRRIVEEKDAFEFSPHAWGRKRK
jgi:hypothetical protein